MDISLFPPSFKSLVNNNNNKCPWHTPYTPYIQHRHGTAQINIADGKAVTSDPGSIITSIIKQSHA